MCKKIRPKSGSQYDASSDQPETSMIRLNSLRVSGGKIAVRRSDYLKKKNATQPRFWPPVSESFPAFFWARGGVKA